MVISTPGGSPLRRYKSVDDFNRVNATLNKLLEKERAERERIDRAALNFLKKVKEDYETQIMTLTESLESLRKDTEGVSKKDLQELKFDLRCAQKDIKDQKTRLEYLRSVKKEAETKCEELKSNLVEKDKEIQEWKAKFETLSSDVKKIDDDRTSYEEKCKTLEKEKAELASANKKLMENNEKLKETCALVESQALKMEDLFNLKVNVEVKLTAEKEEMLEKINKLEKELETITSKYNDQVIEMSTTISSLESSVTEYKEKYSKLEEELKETHKALEEERTFRFLHEDQIPSLLKENELKQKTVDDLKTKLADYEKDIFYLKEESSEHITNIGRLNHKNKQLTLALEEALIKNDTLQQRIEVIVAELEDERAKSQFEKVKFNETINQQLKVIDLLQDKMEKPKKSWFGHASSPSKEPPTAVRMVQMRELEAALERERAKNKTLTRQIDDAKQELRRYKVELRKHKSTYQTPVQDERGDAPITSSHLDPRYSKEIAVDGTPSIHSVPSAPYHHDVDNLTCSSASTSTTDNNDTSEEEGAFIFNDSNTDFGQKKASSVG